ncbi:MAG TPA: molybdenum cofactor biosynthesis protein MoaB, partial [Polyangiaceae bacterium]|nr:molybdenum cofactor biosynthesis protein MoaB [Polyangiaceae bacterium]
EALEHVYERRIEGFGEAWRRLLAEEFEQGPKVVLSRGAAGVYNQCVIFALGGPLAAVRKGIRDLIAPILAEAVELANGRGRSHAAPR